MISLEFRVLFNFLLWDIEVPELNNIKYTTNPILCTYHISSLVNFFVIKLIRFFRSSYVRSVNTVGNKGYDLIIFVSLLSLPPTICIVISQ